MQLIFFNCRSWGFREFELFVYQPTSFLIFYYNIFSFTKNIYFFDTKKNNLI